MDTASSTLSGYSTRGLFRGDMKPQRTQRQRYAEYSVDIYKYTYNWHTVETCLYIGKVKQVNVKVLSPKLMLKHHDKFTSYLIAFVV